MGGVFQVIYVLKYPVGGYIASREGYLLEGWGETTGAAVEDFMETAFRVLLWDAEQEEPDVEVDAHKFMKTVED
jgi:hypothetical protein